MKNLELIIKVLIYNCTVPSVVIPNLLLGILIAGGSAYFLKQSSQGEEAFFQFTGRYRFMAVACLGVMLASPLPFWGKGKLVKLLSVIVLLVVLFVVSYMDEKTTYFIAGYLFAGVLVQIVLLLVSIGIGNVHISPFARKMLFVVVVCNLFLALIKAYSYGDMGLMYMVLLAFLVIEEGDFFNSMVIVYVVSFISLFIRDTVRLPRMIREKKKLKFAHSLNITIGVMASLFFYFVKN